MALSGLVPENRRGCWLSSTAEQHVTDFDRMINQPADLKSNTDMAVIVSSHRTTAATMNSIHSLLSENHPCTLFMGQPPSGYHAPIEQATLSHLLLMTEREPYSY